MTRKKQRKHHARLLQVVLNNLIGINADKMDGVDVIYLGRSESILADVIQDLKDLPRVR